MRSNLITRLMTFVFAVILVPVAFAQTDQGRIAGRVLDPNGAIVPGAIVTVTNAGTNEVRTVTANSDGYFSAPALRAAKYTVAASDRSRSPGSCRGRRS